MTAESKIAAVENLALGEPWAELCAAAEAALAADRAGPEAKVFPTSLVPVDVNTLSLYADLTGRTQAVGYIAAMAAFHERSMVSHPELARCLRSPECLADCGAAAARQAIPLDHRDSHGAAAARAANAAVERYKQVIARQISACPGHELAAAARLLLELDALAARLAAARGAHEAHAAAELERQERERQAAVAAVAADRARRVQETALAEQAATAAAVAANQAHRSARIAAYVADLRASGLKEVRTSDSIYDAGYLVAAAPHWTMAQLRWHEAALAENKR